MSHKRGKRNTRPNQSLIQIEGVDSKEAAQFYLGKVSLTGKVGASLEVALGLGNTRVDVERMVEGREKRWWMTSHPMQRWKSEVHPFNLGIRLSNINHAFRLV